MHTNDYVATLHSINDVILHRA